MADSSVKDLFSPNPISSVKDLSNQQGSLLPLDHVKPERLGPPTNFSQLGKQDSPASELPAEAKSLGQLSRADDGEAGTSQAPKTSKPEEPCANCCEQWFVVTITRKTKFIHGGGGKVNQPEVSLGPIGDWYATAGDMKAELWSKEDGGTKTLLMTCGVVERGGPGTTTENQEKMIPAGTYRLGAASKSHKTYEYNENQPGKKPFPGINVRNRDVLSGRGINIHSGGNWAYSIGCLILVPKESITKGNVTGMTNLAPNWWLDDLSKSYDCVVELLNHLKAFYMQEKKKKLHSADLQCVKLIIEDPQTWDEKIVTPPVSPKKVPSKSPTIPQSL